VGGKNWAWDAQTAVRSNGCANPHLFERTTTDGRGVRVYENAGGRLLDPRGEDNPHTHPENFPPSRMWHGYFAESNDREKCVSADQAVRSGKCVAFGCVSGIYEVERILAQMDAI